MSGYSFRGRARFSSTFNRLGRLFRATNKLRCASLPVEGVLGDPRIVYERVPAENVGIELREGGGP